MVDVNQTPFNKVPAEWEYHPEIGPFIRDLLDEIDQLRRRTGGDGDDVAFTNEDLSALAIGEEALAAVQGILPLIESTKIVWPFVGAIADIPNGFQLCDGTNGTEDLRDRFIVGAGSTYSVGDTGGATTDVTTTSSDTIDVDRNLDGTTVNVAPNFHTHTADILPPYYALAFIQRPS